MVLYLYCIYLHIMIPECYINWFFLLSLCNIKKYRCKNGIFDVGFKLGTEWSMGCCKIVYQVCQFLLKIDSAPHTIFVIFPSLRLLIFIVTESTEFLNGVHLYLNVCDCVWVRYYIYIYIYMILYLSASAAEVSKHVINKAHHDSNNLRCDLTITKNFWFIFLQQYQ